MAGSVLNSSSVFQLNCSAKRNICASIPATSPSREPLAVSLKDDTIETGNDFFIYFVSSFVVADSLVLRNCQLLAAANRYKQAEKPTGQP